MTFGEFHASKKPAPPALPLDKPAVGTFRAGWIVRSAAAAQLTRRRRIRDRQVLAASAAWPEHLAAEIAMLALEVRTARPRCLGKHATSACSAAMRRDPGSAELDNAVSLARPRTHGQGKRPLEVPL